MAGDIPVIIRAAAQRYGVDPQALTRIAQIESRFDPNAQNSRSSAGGLFQFIDGTARQYGLANRFDPTQAADAGARLARDNAGFLQRQLGRAPTPAELYLAHQQGAGGAAALLSNPNALAADIVGAQAVAQNGGRIGMTAGQFADLWRNKMEGGQPNASPDGARPQNAVPPGASPLAVATVGVPPSLGPGFGDMFSSGAPSAVQQPAPDSRLAELFSQQAEPTPQPMLRPVKPPQPKIQRSQPQGGPGIGRMFG